MVVLVFVCLVCVLEVPVIESFRPRDEGPKSSAEEFPRKIVVGKRALDPFLHSFLPNLKFFLNSTVI